MDLILIEDVPSLGKAGDSVKVSGGYARNYLLPRRMAIVASTGNVKSLEHEKRLLQEKLNKTEREAEKLAEKIEELSCTIFKSAGEGGKLFGAVTSHDIEGVLAEHGVVVDRKKIHLEDPIKNLGLYTVPVKVHGNITAHLKLWVVQE